jgi:hypothetical protein
MISPGDLLECLKAMTEEDRRQVVSLLIPSFADMPDFGYLSGISAVQMNQHMAAQENRFLGRSNVEAASAKLNGDS